LKFLFGFFFFSQMVLALEGEVVHYVDEPSSCFQSQKTPCALRIVKSSYKLESPIAKIYGLDGASFVLLENGHIRLLEGTFFIESEKEMTIEAGVVNYVGQGEYLIEKAEGTKTSAVSFAGSLKVRGVFQELEDILPAGFTKWYSGLNQKGNLEQGILAPLHPEKVLPLWRSLTSFSRDLAKKKIEEYRLGWKDRIELTSEFYREIAERKLAFDEKYRMKKEKRLEFERQERMKLLHLYRERNYLH